jgi:oxaloacetate decarboxylase beta subunit
VQEAWQYFQSTGFYQVTFGNLIMIAVGCFFILLAIRKQYEPLLLVPIGFGILIGNAPIPIPQAGEQGLGIGIYEPGSVMNYLYFGVTSGLYPPLIFLGIGAMTDFSSLISQPKLILLGAAAQVGIVLTLLGTIWLGIQLPFFELTVDPQGVLDPEIRLLKAAASIAIIGGADGPTAIFLSSQLAPDLLGAIAISAYSYMALVPVIQPPIMRLLTTKEERLIRMPPSPSATKSQRIFFPIIGLLVCLFIAPGSLPLLGMLFFGNLLKESGVTERLAQTARTSFIDAITILIGVTVGASTQASTFLQPQSLVILTLGAFAFAVATAGGVLFAKLMNLFLKEKINPLIGAAGVSAVPDSARVVHIVAQREDPYNFLITHAMAPNVAGVIGSAVAAGVLLAVLA